MACTPWWVDGEARRRQQTRASSGKADHAGSTGLRPRGASGSAMRPRRWWVWQRGSLPSGFASPQWPSRYTTGKRKPNAPIRRIHRATVIVSAANWLVPPRARRCRAHASAGRRGFCEFAITARRTALKGATRTPSDPRSRVRVAQAEQASTTPCRGHEELQHIAATTWATASGTRARAQERHRLRRPRAHPRRARLNELS